MCKSGNFQFHNTIWKLWFANDVIEVKTYTDTHIHTHSNRTAVEKFNLSYMQPLFSLSLFCIPIYIKIDTKHTHTHTIQNMRKNFSVRNFEVFEWNLNKFQTEFATNVTVASCYTTAEAVDIWMLAMVTISHIQ